MGGNTRVRLQGVLGWIGAGRRIASALILGVLGGCAFPGDGFIARGLASHHYTEGSRRALAGETDAAHRHWQRAADAGHARAAYQLALLHGSDALGGRDQRRALALAAQARARGFAPGDSYIGASLLHGWGGLDRDPAAAEPHLRRALAAGDRRAAADLGVLLLGKAGDGRDGQATAWRRDGLSILGDAAANGDATAQWRLGAALLDPSHGGAREGRRAVALLEAARAGGEARALVPLARFWVTRAPGQARRLLDHALSHGPAHVQVALAKALLDPDDALGRIEGIGAGDASAARALLDRAAASGRRQAATALGKLLATGAPGVEPDPAAAVTHLRHAAEAGSGEAARAMARLLLDQGRDDAARDWFIAAAARGHAHAGVEAARLLLADGDAASVRRAVALLGAIASRHDAAALDLASLARRGVPGLLTPDPALARRWLDHVRANGRPAAAASAANRLARMTLRGEGGAPDPISAQALLHEAAAGGHAWSGLELGRLYDTGATPLVADAGQAAAWYQWAADRGVAEADTALGRLRAGAARAPEDVAAALAHYRRAADAGHAWAVFEAGRLIERGGPGHPGDPVAARAWYRRAAALGVDAAPGALASLHEYGRGVAPDPGRALTLYHRGAQAGNAWATFKVGALLAEGIGVAADPDAARAWLLAARQHGIGQAAPMLARLQAGTIGPFGIPGASPAPRIQVRTGQDAATPDGR